MTPPESTEAWENECPEWEVNIASVIMNGKGTGESANTTIDKVLKVANLAINEAQEQVLRESREALVRTHASIMKNCERHPKGSQGCSFCGTNKMTRLVIGATLSKLDTVAHSHGLSLTKDV